MERPIPYPPPWSTQALWQAANQTIAHTLQHHQDTLGHLVSLAVSIRQRINALDDPMAALCSHTCSRCRSVCCRHAQVYFDFKDLLYLHLGGGALPVRQTMESAHQTCCNLGPDGCHLPRSARPFICTWYLCPDQQARLERSATSVAVFVHHSIKALKLGRKQLETGYIQVIAGST